MHWFILWNTLESACARGTTSIPTAILCSNSRFVDFPNVAAGVGEPYTRVSCVARSAASLLVTRSWGCFVVVFISQTRRHPTVDWGMQLANRCACLFVQQRPITFFFNVLLTLHLSIILDNDQPDAHLPYFTFRLPWQKFFRAFSSVIRQMPG